MGGQKLVHPFSRIDVAGFQNGAQPGSTGNSLASATPCPAADAAAEIFLPLNIVKRFLKLQSLKLNGYLFHRCCTQTTGSIPPACFFFLLKIMAVTKMLPVIVGM